jgi:ABC-type nitrate/sulfonate/bicarbonate transport system substrate-binding protein
MPGTVTTFKVGISEPVNTVLAIWVAEDAGCYAAEGLSVEIVNMSGGSRGAAELAAGRLDAMHVGLSSVVRLNRTGADLRIVAALANFIRFTLFASSGVATPAQLKGGVVGVSTFGSESETVAALALERLGLTRGDVTLKEFGGSARRLAALESGEIAATALNEPAASLAREQGLRILVDLVPERIPWLFTGIAVRREAIGSERLLRFLRAVAEGNALAHSDAARGKAALAKGAGIGNPKIVDIAYEDFRALSPPGIAPTAAAANNILAQFPGVGRDLADYIDTSILDGMRRDGVFERLQDKYPR